MVDAQMHLPMFHSREVAHAIIGHNGVLHRLGETDADSDDAVYLSPLALGLAALLLIINGLLSVYLSLGLHRTLAIAAIRQVAQPPRRAASLFHAIAPSMPFFVLHSTLTNFATSSAHVQGKQQKALRYILQHVTGYKDVLPMRTYLMLLVQSRFCKICL